MVQIIPQDIPLAARMAQGLLVPAGEGFGQGMAQGAQNYQQQVDMPAQAMRAQTHMQRSLSEELIPQINSQYPDQSLNPMQRMIKNNAMMSLRAGQNVDFGQFGNMMSSMGMLDPNSPVFQQSGGNAPQAPQMSPQGNMGTQAAPQSSPTPVYPAPNAPQTSAPSQPMTTQPPQQGTQQGPQQSAPVVSQTGETAQVVNPQTFNKLSPMALAQMRVFNPQLAEAIEKNQNLAQQLETGTLESYNQREAARNQRFETALANNDVLASEVADDPAKAMLARQEIMRSDPNDPEASSRAVNAAREYDRRMNSISELIDRSPGYKLNGRFDEPVMKELQKNAAWAKSKGIGSQFENRLIEKVGFNDFLRNEIMHPLTEDLTKQIDKLESPFKKIKSIEDVNEVLSKGGESRIKRIGHIFKTHPEDNFMAIRSAMINKGIPDSEIMEAYQQVADKLDYRFQPADIGSLMVQDAQQIKDNGSYLTSMLNTLYDVIRPFQKEGRASFDFTEEELQGMQR